MAYNRRICEWIYRPESCDERQKFGGILVKIYFLSGANKFNSPLDSHSIQSLCQKFGGTR